MSSWAARMHRRAATFGNVVTSCGHPSGPYPRRLEKVKFGVPLEEVCKNDIPGPLLVLILKLNKEAPYRKDVFRAPGHQGAMKKLTHFLQTGRLVNMDNFSVYTIASVLKKFLRKLPGGVFGRDVENKFFEVIEIIDVQMQQEEIHKQIYESEPYFKQFNNLKVPHCIHEQIYDRNYSHFFDISKIVRGRLDQITQINHLITYLHAETSSAAFGTFRVIASNSEKAGTGMTSEALGVSVAPSFFHSCVSDGKTAKMEDVMKFKVASRVMKHLIEEFASSNLFGKDNYEYYARVTGRVLRVQGEWICSFQYPPQPSNGVFSTEYVALERYLLGQLSMGNETWLHCENIERRSANFSMEAISQVEECQSTPALLEVGLQPQICSTSLGMIAEHGLLESCTRLSVSLEQNGLFQGNTTSHSSSTSHSSRHSQNHSGPKMTLDELKEVNKYAESTRSLSYLPQVHERQTERMKTRSQWFLGPSVECSSCGGSVDLPLNTADVSALTNALLRRSSSGTIVGIAGLSLSAESVQKRPSVKRSNSRDKRYLYRSTSKRNKENGSRSSSFKSRGERKSSTSRPGSFKLKYENISKSCSFKNKGELCSCPAIATSSSANSNSKENNNGTSATDAPLNNSTAKTTETICVTLKYKPRI